MAAAPLVNATGASKVVFIRSIAAASLILSALVAVVVGLGGLASAYHTVENSRELDVRFKTAEQSISRFRHSHGGRLPARDEWDGVLQGEGKGDTLVLAVRPKDTQCEENAAEFRRLPNSQYVLIAWRGEWWECYAPAANLSSLSLRPEDYTISGYVWLDFIAFIALAAICLLGAFKLIRSVQRPAIFVQNRR